MVSTVRALRHKVSSGDLRRHPLHRSAAWAHERIGSNSQAYPEIVQKTSPVCRPDFAPSQADIPGNPISAERRRFSSCIVRISSSVRACSTWLTSSSRPLDVLGRRSGHLLDVLVVRMRSFCHALRVFEHSSPFQSCFLRERARVTSSAPVFFSRASSYSISLHKRYFGERCREVSLGMHSNQISFDPNKHWKIPVIRRITKGLVQVGRRVGIMDVSMNVGFLEAVFWAGSAQPWDCHKNGLSVIWKHFTDAGVLFMMWYRTALECTWNLSNKFICGGRMKKC